MGEVISILCTNCSTEKSFTMDEAKMYNKSNRYVCKSCQSQLEYEKQYTNAVTQRYENQDHYTKRASDLHQEYESHWHDDLDWNLIGKCVLCGMFIIIFFLALSGHLFYSFPNSFVPAPYERMSMNDELTISETIFDPITHKSTTITFGPPVFIMFNTRASDSDNSIVSLNGDVHTNESSPPDINNPSTYRTSFDIELENKLEGIYKNSKTTNHSIEWMNAEAYKELTPRNKILDNLNYDPIDWKNCWGCGEGSYWAFSWDVIEHDLNKKNCQQLVDWRLSNEQSNLNHYASHLISYENCWSLLKNE